MTSTLPSPSCRLGYTSDDITSILEDRADEFARWMVGQTMALCDGTTYDHDLRQEVNSECWPDAHGAVVYPWDLERFLDGRQIVD